MDTMEFIKERKRMCKSFGNTCTKCPAKDKGNTCKFSATSGYEAAEQIKLLEEWSSEHPCKTRLSVFKEQWPNANIDNQGIPFIYPCDVDKTIRRKDGPCYKGCEECRAEFWTQEVK